MQALQRWGGGEGGGLCNILYKSNMLRKRCPCLVSKDSHQWAVGGLLTSLEPSAWKMDVWSTGWRNPNICKTILEERLSCGVRKGRRRTDG